MEMLMKNANYMSLALLGLIAKYSEISVDFKGTSRIMLSLYRKRRLSEKKPEQPSYCKSGRKGKPMRKLILSLSIIFVGLLLAAACDRSDGLISREQELMQIIRELEAKVESLSIETATNDVYEDFDSGIDPDSGLVHDIFTSTTPDPDITPDPDDNDEGDLLLSQLVGLWELTVAYDAARSPSHFYFVDESTVFVSVDRGAGEQYEKSRATLNPNGQFSMSTLSQMTIEEFTGNKFILSKGVSRLEYTKVTTMHTLDESGFIGTWLISSHDDSHLNYFFMELSEHHSARFFIPSIIGISWITHERIGYHTDAQWFILDNYLIFYSQTSGVLVFSVDGMTSNQITARRNGDTFIFVNQSQITPQILIGDWHLENTDNTVEYSIGGTMPTSLHLETGGTGIWQEGVNMLTIGWMTSDDYLILYSNTNVYFLTIVENTGLSLRLCVDIFFYGQQYFLYTRAE